MIHGDIRRTHSQDFHHDIGGGFRKFTPFHHVLETLRNQWILRNILTKTRENGKGRRTKNTASGLFWGWQQKFRSPNSNQASCGNVPKIWCLMHLYRDIISCVYICIYTYKCIYTNFICIYTYIYMYIHIHSTKNPKNDP